MRRLGVALVLLASLTTVAPHTAGAQSSGYYPKDPYALQRKGNTMFFIARDPSHPKDFLLWRSDGTPRGTRVIDDVNGDTRGYCCSVPYRGSRGLVYFFGHQADFDNKEPWVSDGTAAGTRILKNINSDPQDWTCCYDESFTTVGKLTFFQHWEPGTGYTVWKTNGTTRGTARLKDFVARESDAWEYGDAGFFVGWRDKLFFSGPSDKRRGDSDALWRSNGKTRGTIELQSGTGQWEPGFLSPAGDTLYFLVHVEIGRDRYELWKSDGTKSGTKQVLDRRFVMSYANPVTYRGDFYFSAATRYPYQERLWKSNGTKRGTQPLHAPGMARRSFPGDKVVFRKRLYFVARDSHHNRELWRTNGTRAGTTRVKNINPGTLYDIDNLTVVDGTLFFMLGETDHWTLWKSDGTKRGTVRVRKTVFERVEDMAGMGGKLYFTATRRGDATRYLWRSNGTAAGTHPIRRRMR